VDWVLDKMTNVKTRKLEAMPDKPFRFQFNKAIAETVKEILNIEESVLLTPFDP
jgi:hypothetical protein